MAATVADEAGALLLDLRTSGAGRDRRRRGAEADKASHAFIVSALNQARAGDAVLSEEADDDPSRLTSPRVWIVDPLDGTREFGEPGRVDWAVHVALVVDGDLVAGAVALPAQGRTVSTASPPVTAAPSERRRRVVVSRTQAPAIAEAAARRLDADLVPMGSAGAKAMAVVLGDADAYVHAGGQYEWDSAAPVAVAVAAGLHASRLDGSTLRYNRPDPWLPDLVICRPELAGDIVAVARGAVAGPP